MEKLISLLKKLGIELTADQQKQVEEAFKSATRSLLHMSIDAVYAHLSTQLQ